MHKHSLAFLAGLVVSGAAMSGARADETPQPQPLASGGSLAAARAGAPARARLVVSPTVSQTTVVRMADGSLGMVCEQKRNPAAAAARTNAKTAPERQQ